MVRHKKGRSAKGAARGRLAPSKSASQDPENDQRKKERDFAKAKQAYSEETKEKELVRQPHCIVITRGKVGKFLRELEANFRGIMEPNTAPNLKATKRNNIKDFVVNGAVLGVTNMIVITLGDHYPQLRMMRFSQGPTLTFRVLEYSISRHILGMQKRPLISEKLFSRSPLVVMNGFNVEGQRQLNLAQTFIQNMFPSINVDTLDLKVVKRCLLVDYCAEDDSVSIRQYAIRVVTSGLSKSAKKLAQAQRFASKTVPDLSKYKDISDYFLDPGQLSDSEFEGEQAEVELPQNIGSHCKQGDKSNIRLFEIGPRIKMQLIKVQEGIDTGEVLYHKFVEKSGEDLAELRKNAPKLAAQRKRREKETEHRIIRRLQNAKEKREREEAEVAAITEKAARQQAAASGQTEEIENDRIKDREIAINREREMAGGDDADKRKSTKRGGKPSKPSDGDAPRKKKKV